MQQHGSTFLAAYALRHVPFAGSAHFTLCLPFIDAIINNARCPCENIEKIKMTPA